MLTITYTSKPFPVKFRLVKVEKHSKEPPVVVELGAGKALLGRIVADLTGRQSTTVSKAILSVETYASCISIGLPVIALDRRACENNFDDGQNLANPVVHRSICSCSRSDEPDTNALHINQP